MASSDVVVHSARIINAHDQDGQSDAASRQDRPSDPQPRYAVVFKAHAWDPFIARQLQRYKDRLGRGVLFLFLHESNRSTGPIPFDNVVRATEVDATRLGLANRAERNALFWWNTDYPHYIFYDRYPDFAYYIFAEYDTLVQRDLDGLIRDIARDGADLVAMPTRCEPHSWMWTKYHLDTYQIDDIVGSLNCVSILSAQGLRHLYQRRLDLSKIEKRVRYWPFNEVFMATETVRAGLSFRKLQDYGDISAYEWFPPHLESDIERSDALTFVHPILDRERYIKSLLRFETYPLTFYIPWSRVRRALSRFPASDYKPQLARALWARVRMRAGERLTALLWIVVSQCRQLRRVMFAATTRFTGSG